MIRSRSALGLVAFVFAGHSFACENGSLEQMADTWKNFRKASLTGTPHEISEFYQFPFKIAPPVEGWPPFKITKNIFLKNYNKLFREAVPEQENEIFTNLKSSTDDSYIRETRQEFDKNGCNHLGLAQILFYDFKWRKDLNRWIITRVYSPDYSILEAAFKYGSIKK